MRYVGHNGAKFRRKTVISPLRDWLHFIIYCINRRRLVMSNKAIVVLVLVSIALGVVIGNMLCR